MRPEWLLVLGAAIISIILLVAMRWAHLRDRKIWAQKMEAIEKKYTAGLCESGARVARYRMRFRRIKAKLDEILRRMPPDGP